jgi:hypothetical protein
MSPADADRAVRAPTTFEDGIRLFRDTPEATMMGMPQQRK